MKKVLLTGCGGKVGRAIVSDLRSLNKYEIIATSRHARPESDILALDIRDQEACLAMFKGVDTVIHCGFYLDEMFREKFVEEQIPSNYVGSFNIYNAALEAGVKRVIFCSSNHAIGFYKIGEEVTERSPMRPDSFYGLAKCFTELLGQYYSDRFGISSINLRIGHLEDSDRPWSLRTARIYLSRRDCAQLFEKSIDAGDDVKFATVFGISNNTGAYWSLDEARRVLQYEPQDDGYALLDPEKRDEPIDNTAYMGGSFVHDLAL